MTLQKDDDLHELLAFATDLAQQAGDIMRRYFHSNEKDVQSKDNNTPVTVADHAVNQLVIDSINEHYPHHGVLGEEQSVRTDAPDLWVCDPIDGTRSFITGELSSVFSLALTRDGQPVVAVILEPQQNRLYAACKGEGATVNGQPATVSSQLIDDAWIAATGSYHEALKTLAMYEPIVAKGAHVRLFGGNIFKGGLVAEGRIEGYAFPGRSSHDVVAVKLIVEEAGGKVTDLYGNEQRYDQPINGAIVSNGLIHDELRAIVERQGVENYLGY